MTEVGRRQQGRVALVTGGASGIGAEAVRRLASEGATVVIADVNAEGAEALAAELREKGHDAVGARCDQTRPEELEALFDGVLAAFDRLDVCFANAGWGRVDSFLDLPLEAWTRCLDVNVTGTFLVCQAAAKRMVACGNGGSIVITSSSGAIRPAAKFAAYCTAKAALNMLVQVMAFELGAYGIRVNAVMPGVTETAMTKAILDSGARDLVESEAPLGRTGRPEDIAAAVAHLASDDAAYTTGTALLIDGGGTLGASWFATDFRVRGTADWRLRHEMFPVPPLTEDGTR